MDGLYTFNLPSELIAQKPASPRDHARLLVYKRATKEITDTYFYEIEKYLEPSTVVVANNTKVDHCRYLFHDARTEIFVVDAVNDKTVHALVRPGRKFKKDAMVELGEGLSARVLNIDIDGMRTVEFSVSRSDERLARASHVPLPPYIVQNDTLADEYQTIYAKKQGSLAAPTAGLHFTPDLQKRVADNFGWAEVTLNVGLGTFAPLQESNFFTGTLHSETYEMSKETFERILSAKHVTAVGTTSLRTIESIFGRSMPLRGETDIFITPGYCFARVNSLITNFHLPSTSLLLLVEAYIGSRSEVERVYRHAIDNKYRFYSFGDAMLIL